MEIIKNTDALTAILVNDMEHYTNNDFLNLTDLGYNTEQLQNIWLAYWNLSGKDRFEFDAYHYENTILKNI